MENEKILAFKKNGILDIERIIECYNAYIYKILRNSISNEEDIEEILSDVFIIFWKNYKKLDENLEIRPYLIGITRNLFKKKYREYKMNIENIEVYENNMVSNINIEDLAEEEEKSQIISNCLDNTQKIYRDVFTMFYYNQKKIKGISANLNISEAKVKIILHRARKSIKKDLKKRGYSYGK